MKFQMFRTHIQILPTVADHQLDHSIHQIDQTNLQIDHSVLQVDHSILQIDHFIPILHLDTEMIVMTEQDLHLLIIIEIDLVIPPAKHIINVINMKNQGLLLPIIETHLHM